MNQSGARPGQALHLCPGEAPTPGEARKPCLPPRRRQIIFQFNFLFRLVSNGLIKHCLNGSEREREERKGGMKEKPAENRQENRFSKLKFKPRLRKTENVHIFGADPRMRDG